MSVCRGCRTESEVLGGLKSARCVQQEMQKRCYGEACAGGLLRSEEKAGSDSREQPRRLSDYLVGKEETAREPAGY